MRSGVPGPFVAAIYEPAYRLNAVYVDQGLDGYSVRRGPFVAVLSREFGWDLFAVAKATMGGEGFKPPSQIRHLRVVGTRSGLIPESARSMLVPPYRESGIVLAPVIAGFPSGTFRR